jgi:hypothetical protein
MFAVCVILPVTGSAWCQQGKQQHEQERKKRKRLRNPFHVHAEGVDPSVDDVKQLILQSNLNCLVISNLVSKVKRAKSRRNQSRQTYFSFFCSKATNDEMQFCDSVEKSAPAIGKTKSEKKMIKPFFAKKRGVNPSSRWSSNEA